MVPYIYSDSGVLTVFVVNKSYQIKREDENFQKVFDQVTGDTDIDTLIHLLQPEKKIESFVHNDIVIRDGVLFYKGYPVNSSLTKRVIQMVIEKVNAEPLVSFLGNLMQNPSQRAIMELYDFLQHRALPITPDGYFIGYKAVRHDYTSKTAGPGGEHLDNSIGKLVEIQRWLVDDNRDQGCSHGLHVGTIDYAKSFANSDDKIIIVKVNPKDVVSVPLDSNCEKLRCCSYLVLADYIEDITASIYPPPEDDDDWDDDEYDDGYDDDDDGDDDYEEDSVGTNIIKNLEQV
jgi:hypothetical protein